MVIQTNEKDFLGQTLQEYLKGNLKEFKEVLFNKMDNFSKKL